MFHRPSQVSLFLVAAHSTSSEVLSDFQIWFYLGFPMQSKQARSDPSRGIARPNSSSALILLWLFLHLHLLVFFSTSLQDNWWNCNGWCWTNTKDDYIRHMWNFPLSICRRVGVIVFNSHLGVHIDSIKQQSTATLWVLETCLIVGLLPFMIILITASLSSNTYNKASWRADCTFEERKSTLSRSSIIPRNFFRVGSLRGAARTRFVHGLHRSWLFWYVFPWRIATIRCHKSSAGRPSNLYPALKDMISNSVELCETEVCFWHIQLIGTNVWLPTMHNVPPEVDFESSRSPATVRVLKQSQSALFDSVSHVTILFVITCMMNVRDQTRSSFWPWNIKSSNTCQVSAFQNNFRAYFWQFSHKFHFFFLEVVVIDARSRYFIELLHRLVCQLTISFHTFLGMTFHVIGRRKIRRFSEHGNFSVAPAEILDSNMVL